MTPRSRAGIGKKDMKKNALARTVQPQLRASQSDQAATITEADRG